MSKLDPSISSVADFTRDDKYDDMKKTFLVSLFFVLIWTLSFESYPARSQEKPKGFTVDPFFQDVTLEKDQSATSFQVGIMNNTENLVVLKLAVLDFGTLDEAGGVAFLGSAENLTNKYALASWIILERDGLVLDPGEKQAVKVTIQNKESLTPGGHYAAILAKVDKGENQDNTTSEVAFDSSLSSLVFARKMGGEIYSMELKEKIFSGNIFSEPAEIRLRFQNTGNVHVVPRGLITITDPLGRVVKKGIINDESGRLLPETFRAFRVPLKTLFPIFIPGKYVLSMEYRYENREAFEKEQTAFFLIPWPFLAGIILIIAGIIFWIKARKSRVFGRKNNVTDRNRKKG